MPKKLQNMMVEAFHIFLLFTAVYGFIYLLAGYLLKGKPSKPVMLFSYGIIFVSLQNFLSWLLYTGIVPRLFDEDMGGTSFYTMAVAYFYNSFIHYLKLQKRERTYFYIFATIATFEIGSRVMLMTISNSETQFIMEAHHFYTSFYTIEMLANSYLLLIVLIKTVLIQFKQNGLISIRSYDSLKWLRRLSLVCGGLFLIWLFVMSNKFQNKTTSRSLCNFLRIGFTIAAYMGGYILVLQKKRLVQDRGSLGKKMLIENNANKTANSRDKSSKSEEIFRKVETYLISNKRYLDPALSLPVLAEEMEVSTSHLSKIVNSSSQIGFSDYINKLRVEQATKILSDESYELYTIAAIGMECGFSSTSTFYTAFRKFTGKTPSDYRKQQMLS